MWERRYKEFTFNKFFWLINLFTYDCSMESILTQQYYLSKYVNINIDESELISDLDREFYFSMLKKDKKEEEENLNK